MRKTINWHQWECPCCNGDNLEYGKVEFYDDQLFFPRTCKDCKTEGEEWYNMEFIEHVINEEWKQPEKNLILN